MSLRCDAEWCFISTDDANVVESWLETGSRWHLFPWILDFTSEFELARQSKAKRLNRPVEPPSNWEMYPYKITDLGKFLK